MADALIKAWHGVFDRGTKQAQERLKKAHGHKPEFQAFLKSRGIEGGERSAKQATTSLKKATDTKVAAQKIADMRFKKALQASSDRVREMGRRRREGGEGLGGSLETTKDVIAHIKQYGSIKAGRLGEAMDRTQLIGKVAKDIEKKKAATKIVDRLKTISYGRGAGLNPAKDMKLNPSSPLKTDMSALSNKRHSMNYEEVQIDEVSKAEAEKVLGGAVKEKPKMPPGKQPAGYRYVRGLARKAMKTAMKKEDVEQIDEFVDRETRLAARTAETGSSTRVSSGDVLGRRGGHETPKHAIARRVGKDFYGIKSGGKTSIYNRSPKPNLPEEAEQVDEQDDSMEKKEMAQTQLHFIKYAAEEILAFIDMGGEVEEWYQNKLSKVQSEVESLHSYIEGEKRRTGMVEEVEQIDEISPGLARKAAAASQVKAIEFSGYSGLANLYDKKGKKEGDRLDRKSDKAMDYIEKRQGQKGVDKVNRMVTRVVGEEAEQIDELKKSTLKSYVKKASGEMKKAHDYHQMRYDGRDGTDQNYMKNVYPKAIAKYDRRDAGVEKAKQKLAKEEAEQVTEAEGTVAVTPKEKSLAAHHGDPKKITYGDVIKARLKSAAAKKMGK